MNRRDPWIPVLVGLVLILYGVELTRWQEQKMQRQAPAATPNSTSSAIGSQSVDRAVTPRGDLAADEQSTIDLFNAVSPSVVFITTTAIQRDFFNMNVFEIPHGTGSGFIWDEQGHVVTNFHVIQQAHGVEVTLADQTSWPARVVGVEPDKDLALLKLDIPAGKLKPIAVGRSGDLQVGQTVFAIGNPFGLDHTLTTGVISGLGREIESITRRPIWGVIQTDAAINPGNSGGPLLDSAGRLIGINTAIYSPSGAYAGIGFAVPVDTVARLIPQLIQYGRALKPGLGIAIADDQVMRRFGKQGVLVLSVAPGGPADGILKPTTRQRGGRLALGDIIVGIEGAAIANGEDLFKVLDQHKVGDKVSVEIERDGRRSTVEIELADLSVR